MWLISPASVKVAKKDQFVKYATTIFVTKQHILEISNLFSSSSVKGCFPSKVVFLQRLSSINIRLLLRDRENTSY